MNPWSERDHPTPGRVEHTEVVTPHVVEEPPSWTKAVASEPEVRTSTYTDIDPATGAIDETQFVVDLRSGREALPAVASDESAYGLGRRWGANWATSTQGWVTTPAGNPIWRPIIATTAQLELWDVDTYLGIVTAEVAVTVDAASTVRLGSGLERGRQLGTEGLTEEALERGAHAVIGVTMQYTQLGSRMLITLTGTAVTLREKPA